MLGIIAGKSIDVFELGWSLEKLTKELNGQFVRRDLTDSYVIEAENFKFWLYKSSDTVYQILVFRNYSGKFLDKIGIGNSLVDIEKYVGQWEEVLDAYVPLQHNGICFELKDVDSYDEEWDERTAPIEFITVFHKDFYYCPFLGVYIFERDCSDICMARDKCIKKQVLKKLEKELGLLSIDLDKSERVCPGCRHNNSVTSQ